MSVSVSAVPGRLAAKGRRIAMVSGEPGERMSSLELAPLITAPSSARRYARAVLGAWQLRPDTISTAESLITELVTNSYQAAKCLAARLGLSEPDMSEGIDLTLRLLPDRVVIEVFDRDPNPPVIADMDLESESGRGLMLVQAFSKEWGYLHPPSGGKVVYAIIGVPDAGRPG